MFDVVDIVAGAIGAVVVATLAFLLAFVGLVVAESRITTQCETFNAFYLGEKVYECKRRVP